MTIWSGYLLLIEIEFVGRAFLCVALRIDSVSFDQSAKLGSVQSQGTRSSGYVSLVTAKRLFDARMLSRIKAF